MSTPPIIGWIPKVSAEPKPDEVHRLLTLAFQKINNHAVAFGLQQQKINAIKTGISKTIIEGGGSGGGSIIPFVPPSGIPVNNQSGATSYATVSTDNGTLIVLSDASPISVSLTAQTPPWGCFLTNLGTGTAILTPQSGTINSVATLSLPQDSSALVAFDGTNWWADVSTQINLPLSVADGGTGTSTPGLIAGANVTITGVWPDQTITVVGGTSGFNGGNNANGYWVSDPLGHIHQWGSVYTDINNSTVNVAFPTPFTTLLSISVVIVTRSLTDRITFLVDGSKTINGFTVGNNGSGGYADWSADGY